MVLFSSCLEGLSVQSPQAGNTAFPTKGPQKQMTIVGPVQSFLPALKVFLSYCRPDVARCVTGAGQLWWPVLQAQSPAAELTSEENVSQLPHTRLSCSPTCQHTCSLPASHWLPEDGCSRKQNEHLPWGQRASEMTHQSLLLNQHPRGLSPGLGSGSSMKQDHWDTSSLPTFLGSPQARPTLQVPPTSQNEHNCPLSSSFGITEKLWCSLGLTLLRETYLDANIQQAHKWQITNSPKHSHLTLPLKSCFIKRNHIFWETAAHTSKKTKISIQSKAICSFQREFIFALKGQRPFVILPKFG